MQTIEENHLVSTTLEACVEFGPFGDGSPVCAGCGWLQAEHGEAEVHRLPTRRSTATTPKRIAS